MFYLDDYLTCKKGDEVSGVFSMKPNTRNIRDLDFEIKVGGRKMLLLSIFQKIILRSTSTVSWALSARAIPTG